MRVMPIRVITFDLDNTLWDVEPALLRAEAAQRSWLRAHRPGAIDDINHDELWELRKTLLKEHPELAHHVSKLRETFLYRLQRKAGFSEAESREGARLAFEAFLHERQKVELYSEALGVLEELAQNFKLGALTNGNADVFRTDAGEYFDFAYLAEDVGASKPAAPLFEAAIRRSGVDAGEILHVGDNPEHDVVGARRAGLRAVWINANGQAWDRGEDAQPDAEIRHIGELPGVLAALDF